MSQKIKTILSQTLPVIILATLFTISIIYAWTEPSQAPPGGNVPTPVNVGSTTQYKSGALGIGGVFRAYSGAIFDGKVGIGTINPQAKLDIIDPDSTGEILLKGKGNSWNYSQLKLQDINTNRTWNIMHRQFAGDYPGGFTIEEFNPPADYKMRLAINAGGVNDGRIYLNPYNSGGVSIGSNFAAPAPTGGATRLGDLHVFRQKNGGDGTALVEFCGDGDGWNYVVLTLEAYEPTKNYPHWSFLHRQKNDISNASHGFGIEYWNGATYDIKFAIDTNGNVGIGTLTPKGKLDVNGAIYQRGSLLYSDYVFEPAYGLESIEEHAAYMWGNKHLKSVPKVSKDENGQDIVELGAMNRGILEELEKAHIYIEQLNKEVKNLKEDIELLKAKK